MSAPTETRLEFDLVGDVAAYVRAEIATLEPECADADADPYILFSNVCESFIPIRPRVVVTAKRFGCPPELQAGFDVLVGRVRSGARLRTHQSTKILSPALEVLLLDWGIQQFHLGTDVQPNGLIGRTDRQLIARVTDWSFYVLGVFEEGAWSHEGLVQTIHENWPDSIERLRVRGVPFHERSSKEMQGPRHDGETDFGSVVMPTSAASRLCEGPQVDGTITRAMKWAAGIRERLRWWEREIRTNVADMRHEFPAIFASGAQEIHLRGEVDGRDLFVVHEPTSTRIWVGQLFSGS